MPSVLGYNLKKIIISETFERRDLIYWLGYNIKTSLLTELSLIYFYYGISQRLGSYQYVHFYLIIWYVAKTISTK